MNERILNWDGCSNVRDLGGLNTSDGHSTRRGVIVRSDSPGRLTEAGWAALHAYGIRTIVTLHTHGMTEEHLNIRPPYPDLAMIQVAIEDVTDAGFVQQWVEKGLWSTPIYYRDALQRWPERHAAAISAIAQAQPGGVLFHCIRGNDRTGIIALLLLALAGVVPDEIIADYELSPDPDREEILASQGSSVREALLGAIEDLDIDSYLRMGGARQEDLDAIRKQFLAPA
jgi:protein tyrosine/serine phosphatase